MTRRVLAVLVGTALALGLVARADNPINLKVPDAKKGDRSADTALDPKAALEEAAIKQERLSRQFRDFEGALLRLAQRLETSSKAEDRDKAVVLKKAIDKAMEKGVDTDFDRLVGLLKDSKVITPDYLEKAMKQNQEVADDIRTILAILLTDNRDEELRKERQRVEQLLRRLNEIIRSQQTVRAWTERDMEKARLAREQKDVSQATHDLARSMGKGAGDKENKEAKGENKGEGKKGQGKGEAKEDTKDPKAGDKENKGADKAGANKEQKGDAKPGEGKENKPGANPNGNKEQKGDAKPGDGNKENKGDAKASDKAGDKQNKGGAKGGDPKENKGGSKEGSPSGSKAGESKQGDKQNKAQAGEQKPGENKNADKQGEKADSKGKEQNKGESKGASKSGGQSGKPQEGQQAQSKGGQQGGRQKQGQNKGDGQQQQNKQPQQDQQQDDQLPGRKQIEDAHQDQKDAENNIDKDKRPDAGKNQDDAIEKLNKAKKALEELLRQMREEEAKRLLAALQQRCERMLAMQIEVRDGTAATENAIRTNADKKPTRTEVQRALGLGDREDEIVREATKAIELLQAEGSAVAFPEVFIQVRSDMQDVAGRLRKTDTAQMTQTIEQDIIDSLKEMIEALKQAQKNIQAKQANPPPGGQPPDDKLIDIIAELKMIRLRQIRINTRTKLYGNEFAGREQAPAPAATMPPEQKEKVTNTQTKLRELAEQQLKLMGITEDIAKGRNR